MKASEQPEQFREDCADHTIDEHRKQLHSVGQLKSLVAGEVKKKEDRPEEGEAKEANRRLQEKKEEVSGSLLKVSCLKSLFF